MNDWDRKTRQFIDSWAGTGVRSGSRRVGGGYLAGRPAWKGDTQRYHTNPSCESVRGSDYLAEVPVWEHEAIGTYVVRGPNLRQQQVVACRSCERGEAKHGTETRYGKYGCRCEPCREAKRQAEAKRRSRAAA